MARTAYAQLREKDTLDNPYNQEQRQKVTQQPVTTPASMLSRPQQQAQPNTQAISDYQFANKMDQLFSKEPYKPATQRAPLGIYGDDTGIGEGNSQAINGAEEHAPMNAIGDILQRRGTVQGPNIQPDIPSDNPSNYVGVDAQGNPNPPAPAPLPSLTGSLPTQLATVAPLPVTAPEKPSATEAAKASPEQKDAAKQSVSMLFKSQQPASPMEAATLDSDHDKVQKDLDKISSSKDPRKTWQDMQEEPFYKNSSFYNGLVGVGLSIMSGKSPIEAFQAGIGMSREDDMRNQLQFNRDALIDQGYSPDSVASAISKGDPSVLKMRQRSIEEADEREQALYERNRADTIEDQESAAKRQEARDIRMAGINSKLQEQRDAATERRAQIKADADQKKADAALVPEYGNINFKQFRAEDAGGKVDAKPFVSRQSALQQVEVALENARTTNDPQAKANFVTDAQGQLARVVAGGQATQGTHDREDIAGQKALIDRLQSQLTELASGTITDDKLRLVSNVAKGFTEGDRKVALNTGYSRVYNYRKGNPNRSLGDDLQRTNLTFMQHVNSGDALDEGGYYEWLQQKHPKEFEALPEHIKSQYRIDNSWTNTAPARQGGLSGK